MPVIRDRDTCAPIAGGCTIPSARCGAARARKRAGRRRSRRRGRCRGRCAEASRTTPGPRTSSKTRWASRRSKRTRHSRSCSTMASRSRTNSTRTSCSAPTAACSSCSSGGWCRSPRSPSLRAGRRTAGRRPIRRRRPGPLPGRASRGLRSSRRGPGFGGVGSPGEYCTRVAGDVADPAGARQVRNPANACFAGFIASTGWRAMVATGRVRVLAAPVRGHSNAATQGGPRLSASLARLRPDS